MVRKGKGKEKSWGKKEKGKRKGQISSEQQRKWKIRSRDESNGPAARKGNALSQSTPGRAGHHKLALKRWRKTTCKTDTILTQTNIVHFLPSFFLYQKQRAKSEQKKKPKSSFNLSSFEASTTTTATATAPFHFILQFQLQLPLILPWWALTIFSLSLWFHVYVLLFVWLLRKW